MGLSSNEKPDYAMQPQQTIVAAWRRFTEPMRKALAGGVPLKTLKAVIARFLEARYAFGF